VATSRSPSGLADQVGRVLGDRYRLVAPIGTGASAQVHLADDVRLGRRVAVKVLHPGLAADETFLRRFRAEARSAASLSHPNIMAVYDWGEDSTDAPYLVLELLSGGSLRSMLDTGTQLSLSQALVVGLEAGRALEAAHRSGFVHRDIKPANLLFGDDSRLRVADFGLARALSEAAWTEPGDGLVGTARYAAPEQASTGRVDGKADVYALALVLIEAVTGSVPRVADSALATIKLRADEPVPVPTELGVIKPLLERALQPDPDARPDSAALVQGLLVAARQLDRPAPLPLVGLPVPSDDATVATAPVDEDITALPPRGPADLTMHAAGTEVEGPPKRRRWRWLVALLVVAALVVGGFLLWSASQAPTAKVPNVAGQELDAARDAIAAALDAEGDDVAWDVAVEDEFSDAVEKGAVIRSEPGGGASLADDGRLTLFVSGGPEPVPVPDLFNYTQPEVQQILEENDLALGTVTPVFNEDIGEGRVVTWGTAEGEKPSELPKGSAVDVQLSQGPEPRTIAEYKGAPKDDVVADLEKQGLKVAVEEAFSDDVEAGRVVSTDPAAGQQVPKGGAVTVVVSKGPDLVEVPDVVGMRFSDAYDTLVAAGFQVKDEGEGNRVVGTDPEGGSKVKRGSTVTIQRRR
jgi:serine/threonine-protein kinase